MLHSIWEMGKSLTEHSQFPITVKVMVELPEITSVYEIQAAAAAAAALLTFSSTCWLKSELIRLTDMTCRRLQKRHK